MKEKEIQDQILEGLAYHGKRFKTVVWRNNTGAAKFSNSNGTSRFVRFGIPGAADITGICHGRRLDIEVKKPGGRQSVAQREYEQMIKENGGIYFVATSFDDAMSKLYYEVRLMQREESLK